MVMDQRLSTLKDDDYYRMLQEVDEGGTGCTSWELDFLDAMMKKGRGYSDREKNKIMQIYDSRMD